MGILRLENVECLEKVCICMCFIVLCYAKDRSTDMLEDQVAEERDLDLNEEEDVRLAAIREYHWMDVSEECDNKKTIHSLRC